MRETCETSEREHCIMRGRHVVGESIEMQGMDQQAINQLLEKVKEQAIQDV